MLLAGIVVAGFALRVANFGQGFYGDELSTAWVVLGRSPGSILHIVHGDAEISPPLYFLLAWASSKLGSNPDLLRLPSLVAGTATIPLVYLVGARTVGRRAGLAAAAIVALSPFLIFYSTEARAYAVMIALVTGATLALLEACENGRTRWWIAYAALSAAAMYTHYTAAFPLAAQALWALWAHPGARRGVLAANLLALALFAPGIPGYLADRDSPTLPILSALAPFDLHAIRVALQYWALGMPGVKTSFLPGDFALVLIAAGVGLALGYGALRVVRRHPWPPASESARSGVALVFLLALATPLGEAIYSLLGTNLLGARDLNASWPGLALAAATLLTALRPPVLAAAATAATVAGLSIGAIRTQEARFGRPDYPAVAEFVDSRIAPGDVVMDAAAFTPTPQTPLGLYLRPGVEVFEPLVPEGPPPFTAFSRVPPTGPIFRKAIADARNGRIYLVAISLGDYVPDSAVPSTALVGPGQEFLDRLPRGYRTVQTEQYPGLLTLTVKVIEGPGAGG